MRLFGDEALGVLSVGEARELTPVERCGNFWLKRDDTYEAAGVSGGKARACWSIASRAAAQGAEGLITSGARHSPQVNIVAQQARELGLRCRVHVPAGEPTPELRAAADAGADVVWHRPGYNTVIVARAAADAAASPSWREVPFGMECAEQIRETAQQVANLPDIERLVVPVGSGMSLAGILWGLHERERQLPVVGVVVGAAPERRLDRYAPLRWPEAAELRRSRFPYVHEVPLSLNGVVFDPIYEAKCVEHLEPGDCLWVVGIRQTWTH